jgi:hypothetical protein
MSIKNREKNKLRQIFQQGSGQAMLILVLILGATMLGVTTIAGYVSLQKIRTATDIVDSTKAIYAADSGVEWCFYEKFFLATGTSTPPCAANVGDIKFDNGASVSVVEQDNEVKSIGTANRAYRAFGIFLDQFGF